MIKSKRVPKKTDGFLGVDVTVTAIAVADRKEAQLNMNEPNKIPELSATFRLSASSKLRVIGITEAKLSIYPNIL